MKQKEINILNARFLVEEVSDRTIVDTHRLPAGITQADFFSLDPRKPDDDQPLPLWPYQNYKAERSLVEEGRIFELFTIQVNTLLYNGGEGRFSDAMNMIDQGTLNLIVSNMVFEQAPLSLFLRGFQYRIPKPICGGREVVMNITWPEPTPCPIDLQVVLTGIECFPLKEITPKYPH